MYLSDYIYITFYTYMLTFWFDFPEAYKIKSMAGGKSLLLPL